jgi:molybdenum cofactor cytidylyltransferase
MAGELPPCIVLAAGKGSRAGGPKALREIDGRPLVSHQLDALAAVGVSRAIVVVRRELEAEIRRCGARDVCINDEPDLGQFSSVLAGAACVLRDESASAAFVLPVDVPCPSAAVWRALAESLGAALCAQPRFHGRGGHPLLCARALVASLCTIALDRDDARLDVQLHRVSRAVVEVDDARVIANWNQPEDFFRVL